MATTQDAEPSETARLRFAALMTLGTLVAARTALVTALELILFAQDRLYADPPWWANPITWSLIIIASALFAGAGAFSVWRLTTNDSLPEGARQAARFGVRWGVAAAILLVFANYQRHLPFFDNAANEHGWDRGFFPFDGGTVRTDERYGYVGTGHIHPDGYRICAPLGVEPQGDVKIAWIGDSFTYGLAVDDDATQCWRLREHYEQERPGAFAFVNLGQPGASMHSYVRTLHYAVDTLEADAAIVGLLLPNDSEVYDRNAARPVHASFSFRLASSVLDPGVLYSLALMHVKSTRAEFFERVSIEVGLQHLSEAATELGVPVMLFMWDSPDPLGASHGNELAGYEALVADVASKNPWLTSYGIMRESDGTGQLRIPRDFHPTREGHAHIFTKLQPAFEDWTINLPEATP